MNSGRVHLPVSPVCNIQCRFCRRDLNKTEQRPGVTAKILTPEEAVDLVSRALELCPEITVAGIAGPGDTLATPHALAAFRLIHEKFPALINCLSSNGLLLERYAEDLIGAGVQTITVTVNAVAPEILTKICALVMVDGIKYEGEDGAARLIAAQERGIKKAAALGALIKINIVLVPSINGGHIEEIARSVKAWGANLINIIPLIPQNEMADLPAPDCVDLGLARQAAEKYLPVFRHCQHCRADACGIPGKSDFAKKLHNYEEIPNTFSHG